MSQGRAIRASVLITLLFLPAWAEAAVSRLPLPESVPGSISLSKTALHISYNTYHKQADWVSYELGPDHLQNCVQRGNSFRPDPEIPASKSAALSDYVGSGFDRGHMSPAADNKWSATAMNESFLLSNVSPQPAAFNRGIWGRLELLVRAWAMKTKGLWVTTGPVLDDTISHIGDSRISTPNFFYKVLVSENTHKAIAFLLPVTARGDLSAYAVPVRSVEEQAGLNFHEGLDSRDEDNTETTLSLKDWDFNADYEAPDCETGKTVASWQVPGLFASWQ